MIRTLPPVERLRELFGYDPDTGVVVRKIRQGRAKAGSIAGVESGGRLITQVDGHLYKLHRLIWKIVTGEEPPAQIDHRDLDGINNRWGNLRAATQSLNMANRGAQANGSSGLKGAYFHKASGLWMSRIQKDGVDYPLGYFKSREDAHAAYSRKATELFGEFARAA